MKMIEIDLNIMSAPQSYYLAQGDFKRSQFFHRTSGTL